VEIGVLEHATVRLPLVESPPEHLEVLRAGLKESGLL
jgi:4-hydroxy-tetrahydrodipicolinate synthase